MPYYYRRLHVFALAASLLAAVAAAGCAGSQPATMDGSADGPRTIETVGYDVEDLEYPELPDFQIPQVEEMTLGNGLKVFLIEDRELPTISASARVTAGEVWNPSDHAGLASITGTTMRTGGTQSMSSDEINQLLENLGATVETSIGGTRGSAYMNTLAENVGQVLPVFVEVLSEPAFAQDKIEQAKSQTKSAISRRNDEPSQIVNRVFDDLVYGEDSPYAREPQYYTVDEISRDDVVNFHSEYFHPNNTILSVWGDFDAADMKRQLRRAFSSWEEAPGFSKPALPEPRAEENGYSVHLVEKEDINQSTVRMGYMGELTRDDPDYFPVVVMNEVLSGGFSGRLLNSVRTEQGLAYSTFGRYGAGYEIPQPFFAQVQTKSGSTVEGAQAVINEIEGMRENPATEEEVRLAKESFLNSFVFNFDTRREILGRLMTYEDFGYPRDFLEQTRQGVANVTPDDVHRVSRAYLHPDRLDVLVLGRPQDFDQPLSALAQGGEVNAVDISIPTSAPGEEEAAPVFTDEDRAAGRDLLTEVREAMGGDAYDAIENMRQTAETVAQTPQGEQTIGQMLATNFAGQVHAEVTLPNGLTITIIDDGEQMMLQTPQGTQPAPPQLQQQIDGSLQRDLTYLMTQPGELEVADQGTQTVEGTTYRALSLTPPSGGDAFTLMVDPGTMMPARMVFEQMGPQGPAETTAVYSDFQEVDGVMVPFTVTGYQNGEQATTTTVSNFETNVDFPAGYFSVE